ncbi:MAG: hypothetical protein RLZ92_1223 [Pseudomonadota bacterium]|jgi:hypothetical protein
MYPLLQLFLEITAFRKGPQDVPTASWLMPLILLVYVLVNLAVLLLSSDLSSALMQVVVDFVLMSGFIWPLLFVSAKLNRYRQTLVALLGTDALINFFALPTVASLTNEASDLGFFAMLMLMMWHWAVTGHILRHALDRPLFFGLGVAFLYLLISSQVMEVLFPMMTTTTIPD